MTDLSSGTAARRPRIELPNGDTLEPRREFARDTLGVCDKTAQRMNLPTTYIANVAYVARNASLKIIAERIQRRGQQRRRRTLDAQLKKVAARHRCNRNGPHAIISAGEPSRRQAASRHCRHA